ncbi:MAG: hypothetical protein US50_C0038G0016 [Candidatus Nomurabacteria bacterium GW2011_GWB1_37_5]|uniref:Bacterial spore germination immunoglobulin-like domain-containing protein n=1 Tax=Candidatus Nomurabacteria bacterium GW2011_GWB1_37_5 TaxID=1618742 RepID=A0A0G0K294_9BACT|nr:MAG: hypothetical protein US50_C0038G0016 [Candidatus Nomurabacteria bacterium GW2011_GWB1_37_5]
MQTQKGFINVLLIIVLVLVIGGVGYWALNRQPVLDEQGISNGTPTEQQGSETSSQDSLTCGIFVEKPASGAELVIGNTFQVKGYVNGCGWTAFEAEAAVVSIEDVNGNVVMNKTPVPVQGEWMQIPAYFDSAFTPKLPATAGTGFVIFENEDPSGENPQIFKVPVTFGTD